MNVSILWNSHKSQKPLIKKKWTIADNVTFSLNPFTVFLKYHIKSFKPAVIHLSKGGLCYYISRPRWNMTPVQASGKSVYLLLPASNIRRARSHSIFLFLALTHYSLVGMVTFFLSYPKTYFRLFLLKKLLKRPS